MNGIAPELVPSVVRRVRQPAVDVAGIARFNSSTATAIYDNRMRRYREHQVELQRVAREKKAAKK